MIVLKYGMIYSDSDKVLHRKGTKDYFRKAYIIEGDSVDNYEEVDDYPSEELEQVREAKIAEIYAYDKSDDVNWFYINGVGMWLNKEDRIGIVNSTNSEIKAGRDTTTLWSKTVPPIPITLPCETALEFLSVLEVYCLDCYNATAKHVAEVCSLNTIEEIESYNYKTGYPEKLNLSIE